MDCSQLVTWLKILDGLVLFRAGLRLQERGCGVAYIAHFKMCNQNRKWDNATLKSMLKVYAHHVVSQERRIVGTQQRCLVHKKSSVTQMARQASQQLRDRLSGSGGGGGGGGGMAGAGSGGLLPTASSDFHSQEYWDSFFHKRGSQAFEWYFVVAAPRAESVSH